MVFSFLTPEMELLNTGIPCISYSQFFIKSNQLLSPLSYPRIVFVFAFLFVFVFVLPIPTYLAFLVPSHPGIGAGRGLDQRKSPTGGNAYGRDLHRREYDAVVLIGGDEDDDEEEGEEPESRIGKTISASQHLTHYLPLGKNHFLEKSPSPSPFFCNIFIA